MKVINAFDWRNFECPVTGKISWSVQNKEKQSSLKMASFIERQRKVNPAHGTLFGISKEVVSVKPMEMMRKPN
jgi:hypothetical protein